MQDFPSREEQVRVRPHNYTDSARGFKVDLKDLQQVVIPWRNLEAEGNSVPPRFDLEECQRFLRERKEHQST